MSCGITDWFPPEVIGVSLLSLEGDDDQADEDEVNQNGGVPGLTRLVVNYAQRDHTGAPPPYDAIAEDWFESGEAMVAGFQSAAGEAVQHDAPNFLDMTKFQMIVVQEDEIMAARAATAT